MEKNNQNPQYDNLCKLSSAELKHLLKKDLWQEESDQALVEQILAILSLREDRSPEEREALVQSAWEDFNRRYRTPEGENQELYPMFPVEPEAAQPNSRRKGRPLSRKWMVAAAVITLLIAMALPVFGSESFFSLVGQWTGSVFYFVRSGDEETAPENREYASEDGGLNQIWDVLESHNLTSVTLPTKMPEGYILADLNSNTDGLGNLTITALFENGERRIIFHIGQTPGNSHYVYEKDDTPVEIYQSKGREFYIIENMGRQMCCWGGTGWECSFSGVLSREEIYLIIDSIQ